MDLSHSQSTSVSVPRADRDTVVPCARGAAGLHALHDPGGHLERRLHLCRTRPQGLSCCRRLKDLKRSLTHPCPLQQPLFPGDCELQQLLHIFKLLGTPTEDNWPGVTRLRDWHEWPQWQPQDLSRVFPTLEADGIDLMKKMMEYDPARRISVRIMIASLSTSYGLVDPLLRQRML